MLRLLPLLYALLLGADAQCHEGCSGHGSCDLLGTCSCAEGYLVGPGLEAKDLRFGIAGKARPFKTVHIDPVSNDHCYLCAAFGCVFISGGVP